MAKLDCYLFGKFNAFCYQEQISSFQSQKALELLCYLLLNRERPQHREILSEALWGQKCNRPKAYLRKAIWQLKKSLSVVPAPIGDRLLQIDPEWLQIRSDVDIWTDVWVFGAAYKAMLGILGHQLGEAQFAEIQKIVTLYRGDLLEGWYVDWCIYERERYREMYLMMIDKLMEWCEVQHKYELGIMYGKEILRHDHARERTYRRLMRLYHLSGDRTGALRHFKRCKEILQDELKVAPSQRTVTLFNRIVNDHVGGPVGDERAFEKYARPLQNQIGESFRVVNKLLKEQSSNQDLISEELKKLERSIQNLF